MVDNTWSHDNLPPPSYSKVEEMEYKRQLAVPQVKPRLIIHGGAGNITPEKLGPEKYKQYRHALLTIVSLNEFGLSGMASRMI